MALSTRPSLPWGLSGAGQAQETLQTNARDKLVSAPRRQSHTLRGTRRGFSVQEGVISTAWIGRGRSPITRNWGVADRFEAQGTDPREQEGAGVPEAQSSKTNPRPVQGAPPPKASPKPHTHSHAGTSSWKRAFCVRSRCRSCRTMWRFQRAAGAPGTLGPSGPAIAAASRPHRARSRRERRGLAGRAGPRGDPVTSCTARGIPGWYQVCTRGSASRGRGESPLGSTQLEHTRAFSSEGGVCGDDEGPRVGASGTASPSPAGALRRRGLQARVLNPEAPGASFKEDARPPCAL